jgi:hypothetical protein
VVLRHEDWFDRLGKRLRINREIEVGDPDFDRAIYVDSDASDATVLALLDPEMRSVVREIVAKGLQLTVEASRLVLRVPPDMFERDRDVAESLVALLRALEAAKRATPSGEGPYRDGKIGVPRAVPSRQPGCLPVFFGFGAIAVLDYALPAPPPTSGVHGYAFGVALWIVAVAIFVRIFRGRASSMGDVTLSAICYLVILPLGSILARAYNATVDHGRESTWQAEGRHESRKGKAWVEVELTSSNGDAPRTFAVPYGRVQSASGRKRLQGLEPVVVTTKPGALGWEWVVRVDVR